MRRYERWQKRAAESTKRAMERMKRALDVRKAEKSLGLFGFHGFEDV